MADGKIKHQMIPYQRMYIRYTLRAEGARNEATRLLFLLHGIREKRKNKAQEPSKIVGEV